MSQALAHLVTSVLGSAAVGEINFSMGGITVSAAGFHAVQGLITHDVSARPPKILINEITNITFHGFLGLYRPGPDILDLGSLADQSTPAGKATIVHECTHAQVDMRRLQTPILTEEGAAYIAETWYLLAAGHPVPAGMPLAFDTIASALRARSRPGQVVAATRAELNDARDAARELGYESGHYFSNGIRGCTNPQRIQRGQQLQCMATP